MAKIYGLKVMVNLPTFIAEAFDTGDACSLACLRSLDTLGRNRIVF